MNDKVVRLVAHLFSPGEAEIARHLPLYFTRPVEKIAARLNAPPNVIRPHLEAMAERRVIYRSEKGYSLVPLIPGMFEYILMTGRDTPWHRKYAELITDLYYTGFIQSYTRSPVPAVRNIPVQRAIETKNHVVDADLMSEMIERHSDFAVLNVCQCRQTQRFLDEECKRSSPEDGCLAFGSFAVSAVGRDSARFVSKEEMRDIVQERFDKNLVFLTANVSPSSSNAICTCCDCCCHYIKSINQFGAMNSVAPPHFLATLEEILCNNCGKCVRVCNTHAHSLSEKKHLFDQSKCIGCGACEDLCPQGAISLVENRAYKAPSRDFTRLGLKLLPRAVLAALRAKIRP
ncbi:MAG: 4Fe-4S binding protein [Deltaproteobacteria bacterium]|nr:4Fe-4S binding protein [Deltaproteobacteria bacterium]